jgi:hypothetical protein
MIPLVPGSLAFIYLFLVVVLGRCNRQGPIKKSPTEGDTLLIQRQKPKTVAYSKKIQAP